MKHGFIKVAAVTPKIKVGDPVYNTGEICSRMEEAASSGAKIIVFPELCLTGATCGDLFHQDLLLTKVKECLFEIAEDTKELDALAFIGLPLMKGNKLYNTAAAIYKGKILGLIPKRNHAFYGEFYEGRYFAEGNKKTEICELSGPHGKVGIPFGSRLLFDIEAIEGLKIGCEICGEVWMTDSGCEEMAAAGATVIVNPAASHEVIGKREYRELLVRAVSGRLTAGYVYVCAGEGESSQDMVFAGHNMVVENGRLLSRSMRFDRRIVYADLDIHRLIYERRRKKFGSALSAEAAGEYLHISVPMKKTDTELCRVFRPLPFVPENKTRRDRRCAEILSLQAHALKKRCEHTNSERVVLGLSGGLDSTLALLACVRAFDLMGLDRSNIITVTMPCFGTTDRTYENACRLAEVLGTSLKKVFLEESVLLHFRDIGQDVNNKDVTYENSQARERTQVLMDIANMENGLVIGTGDMSELALGWATYNGDHMSMYGINAGIPKTLVRYLVEFHAEIAEEEGLKAVLMDILDTPVSPELLPPVDGVIAQKTEDLVGPYELHDFFLYYMLRWGYPPEKIYRLTCMMFGKRYEEAEIIKWMKTFYLRFFSQQFKRSCMPDGPKVGSISLSPRSDLRMPSDACGRIWLEELEMMKI